MKLKSRKEETFGEEYKRRIIDNPEQCTERVGDVAQELNDAHARELSDILKKHNKLEGTYYIFVLYARDPQFPTAIKNIYCTLRPEQLNRVPKYRFGSELWLVDNAKGKMDLKWALPPKAKALEFLKKPNDPLKLKWILKAIQKEKESWKKKTMLMSQ